MRILIAYTFILYGTFKFNHISHLLIIDFMLGKTTDLESYKHKRDSLTSLTLLINEAYFSCVYRESIKTKTYKHLTNITLRV